MKENSNTAVDFEWQSIQIAKEITIAKLQTSAPNSSDAVAGKKIGEMFLAIHEEVTKAFSSPDK